MKCLASLKKVPSLYVQGKLSPSLPTDGQLYVVSDAGPLGGRWYNTEETKRYCHLWTQVFVMGKSQSRSYQATLQQIEMWMKGSFRHWPTATFQVITRTVQVTSVNSYNRTCISKTVSFYPNNKVIFRLLTPRIFLQLKHQPTNALNKMQFITSAKLLRVSAPWWHPQGI